MAGKGGRKAADMKPRVAGPGAASQRTDLSRPKSPFEAESVPAGSTSYSERKDLVAAQSAISPTGPQSGGPPAGGGGAGGGIGPGRDPRQILSLLGEGGTQRPGEDVTAGAYAPQEQVAVTAREAAFLLEEAIKDMPMISASTLSLLEDLKLESMRTFEPPIAPHIAGPI